MEKHPKKKSPKRSAGPVNNEISTGHARLWLAGILALTFIVFIPAIKNRFITFDDSQYVVENPYIKGFSVNNLKAVISGDANKLGNYHPITLLSYMANYALSQLDPAAYHLTNILLHLVNVFLVFQLALALFTRLGSGRTILLSSITALLFAIHPLHVESVAWVSGRKDLLYTCFYLLSLISYIRYLDKKSMKNYFLSLLFFMLSLLSKGMAVTLSLSVVALDYLFKRDLLGRRVIAEKIPFFLFSLFFGVIAVMVQQAQGATEIIKFNLFERFIFASFGFAQYLVKTVIPYKLCGYYPYPDLKSANIPWPYYLALLPVLLTAFLLFRFIRSRTNRTMVFGMLFFILNVIFVLQLFPVGSAVMADRYTYLSSFGLFIMVAAGIEALIRKYAASRILILGILFVCLGALAATASRRCTVWHDSYSFWNDVAVKYPAFYPAINNLGVFKEEEGKTQEAIDLFSNSIRENPDNASAWYHRGSIYGKAGQYREAIADLGQAIRYSPAYTKAYINRAIAKAMIKDYPGALADLDRVLRSEKNEEAYFNRGILENEMKEYAKAIPDLQEAVDLNPSCIKCYYSLGLANFYAKRFSEAIRSFSACIGMNPAADYAYYYRAVSYIEAGKPDSSCNDLQKAANLGVKEAEPFLEQYCHDQNR